MKSLALLLSLGLLAPQARANWSDLKTLSRRFGKKVACEFIVSDVAGAISTTPLFKSRLLNDEQRLRWIAIMGKRQKRSLLLHLMRMQKDSSAIRFGSRWIVEIAVRLPMQDSYDREIGQVIGGYFTALTRDLREYRIPRTRNDLPEVKLFVATQVERLLAEIPMVANETSESGAIFDMAFDYYHRLWDRHPAYFESEEFKLMAVNIIMIAAMRSYSVAPDRFDHLKSLMGFLSKSPLLSGEIRSHIEGGQRVIAELERSFEHLEQRDH